MPILGADFLAHYDLTVHMNSRTLSDNTTNIKTTGTRTHHTTGISVATYHSREYLDILNQHLDLLRPMKYSGSNTPQTKTLHKNVGTTSILPPLTTTTTQIRIRQEGCYAMALSDRQTVHMLLRYTWFPNLGALISGSV